MEGKEKINLENYLEIIRINGKIEALHDNQIYLNQLLNALCRDKLDLLKSDKSSVSIKEGCKILNAEISIVELILSHVKIVDDNACRRHDDLIRKLKLSDLDLKEGD